MYVKFYKGVEPYSSKVVFAYFPEVTSSFESVLERVNSKFGTHFASGLSSCLGDAEILDKLREHSANIGWDSMTSAPSIVRNKEKEKVYDLMKSSKFYPECDKLYSNMCEMIKSGE